MRTLSTILIEADNADSIFKLHSLLGELKQTAPLRDPVNTQFGVEHITARAEQIGVKGSFSYEQFKKNIKWKQ